MGGNEARQLSHTEIALSSRFLLSSHELDAGDLELDSGELTREPTSTEMRTACGIPRFFRDFEVGN